MATGLTHYRKFIVALLGFINVLVMQYTTIAGSNKPLWTAIGTGVAALLVYLTPNAAPAPSA